MKLSRRLVWWFAVGTAAPGLVLASVSCEQIIGLEPGELRTGGSAPTTSQGAAGAAGAVGGSLPGGAGGAGGADGGTGGVAGSGGTLPEPEVLAEGVEDPTLIAVGGGYVFWTSENESTLSRVPTGGGDAVVLATTSSSTLGVGVLDDRVYWAAEEGPQMGLWSLPTNSEPTAPTPVDSSHEHPYGIATLPGVGMVWTDRNRGSVFLWKDGSASPLAANQGWPLLAALTSDYAHWVVEPNPASDPWRIRRVPVSGGQVEEVASTGTTALKGVAASGTTVFWAEPGAGGAVKKRDLSSADPAHGVPVAVGLADPALVAVDGTDVYWTNHGIGSSDGSVMHCAAPYPCSSPRVLARDQPQPYGIALEDQYVYWVNRGIDGAGGGSTGQVMRVPRQ